jgi:hypothetical protein
MEYCINIKNNKINTLLSIFIINTLILAPLGVSSDVFAQGGVNSANQGIGQSQADVQNALCLSGALTGPACNNTSVQGQSNTGSNTAGQTAGGGTGKHHGSGGVNSANQGIGQSQSNQQSAQCVSGTSIGGSCNNTSVQGQSNTGSNTAGQTAGGGTGKHGSGGVNSANQGIGQSQSNQQSAQCVAAGSLGNSCKGNPNATCVSGKDKIVSCTPEEFQKLINSGKTLTANLSNQH